MSQRFTKCSVVYYLFLMIRDLSLAIQSQKYLSFKRQAQHKDGMLSTALGFPKCKGHWPLLYFGTGGRRFFQRVAATMSSTQVWRTNIH